MRKLALSIICAFVLIAASPLLAQQTSAPVSSPQTNGAKQQSTTSTPTSSDDTAQSTTTQTSAGQAVQSPTVGETGENPKEEAWGLLDTACAGDQTGDHALAVRVLGLMPNDAKALALAEQGLESDKPEIRAAAAAALGDMKARASIPKLREALEDNDPLVALAAANSLNLMRDNSAYQVYYEVLTRQRKAGKGLIATEMAVLKDPKKMAQLGFEEGIGFVPFAGIGWGAVKTIAKDDASPVRAAAAKLLASDPDPAATRALTSATGDKSWLVRAAALEALAKRGNPSALPTVTSRMSDEKTAVKYTAAAATLRLTAIKEGRSAARGKRTTVKAEKK